MKYIKKYEENNIPNFKKYIIWKYMTGYAIFELLEYNSDNDININYLYQYHEDTHEIIKREQDNGNLSLAIDNDILENFKKFCIYQSDSLEDCLEFLESIDAVKRYNI